MATIKTKPLPFLKQSDVDRFWSKVNKTEGLDGCWLWTGMLSGKGYGWFKAKGRMLHAHRVSVLIDTGKDPLDSFCLHKCDTPSCVRPDHIFLGDHKDNMSDMAAKGRAATGERSGWRTHPESFARGDQHWSKKYPEKFQNLRRAAVHGKVPKGEANHFSKLTEQQVLEIRRLHAAKTTVKELCRMFNIGHSNVWNITARKSWKHVT